MLITYPCGTLRVHVEEFTVNRGLEPSGIDPSPIGGTGRWKLGFVSHITAISTAENTIMNGSINFNLDELFPHRYQPEHLVRHSNYSAIEDSMLLRARSILRAGRLCDTEDSSTALSHTFRRGQQLLAPRYFKFDEQTLEPINRSTAVGLFQDVIEVDMTELKAFTAKALNTYVKLKYCLENRSFFNVWHLSEGLRDQQEELTSCSFSRLARKFYEEQQFYMRRGEVAPWMTGLDIPPSHDVLKYEEIDPN